MNDYSKVLYRILRLANCAVKQEEVPAASEIYLPDIIKATETEIETMIYQAYQDGLISGVRCVEIDGLTKPAVLMSHSHICITIKGQEYLSDNSKMKKIASAMKGIKDIIPGI